jgi:hypothetical protein
MWPVTIATIATAKPPTNGTTWEKKERTAATRLTTARLLVGATADER